MFMRAVGQATITFDPHFASAQISPLLFRPLFTDWVSCVLEIPLISKKFGLYNNALEQNMVKNGLMPKLCPSYD